MSRRRSCLKKKQGDGAALPAGSPALVKPCQIKKISQQRQKEGSREENQNCTHRVNIAMQRKLGAVSRNDVAKKGKHSLMHAMGPFKLCNNSSIAVFILSNFSSFKHNIMITPGVYASCLPQHNGHLKWKHYTKQKPIKKS